VAKLDEVSALKRTVKTLRKQRDFNNVLDSVPETSEIDKSAIISNNKQTEQCVKDLKSLEKELVSIRQPSKLCGRLENVVRER
jgi:CCR4-NOT transcriptional regulation complex NOT5 subunit